jgi:predicted membrane metal-binding protein
VTPLNIVSATAVFLLIISPIMAFDTGFQMSMAQLLALQNSLNQFKNFSNNFSKRITLLINFLSIHLQ